jgi:hypothetical protein
LSEAETRALLAEFRAAGNAEDLAAFRKARVAYVVKTRDSALDAHGNVVTLADLLRAWKAEGITLSDARVSQMHTEVGYMVLAGFDVAQDGAAVRDAYRVAVALRKVSYGRGDAAIAEKASNIRAALATVAGDLAAFREAVETVRKAGAETRRESGATSDRPGASEGHAGDVARDVAGGKSAWLAALRTLAALGEAGRFALTSVEAREVDGLLARIASATVGDLAAA